MNCTWRWGFLLVKLSLKSSLQFCNRPHLNEKLYGTQMLPHCSMLHGELNCKVNATDTPHILYHIPVEKNITKLLKCFTVFAAPHA
jgi:hypothetical protein